MKVHAYVTHNGQRRKARGFSCAEIVEAGLTCQQYDALRLQWDSRRSSSYKENVETLKKLEKPVLKAKAQKTETKKPVAKPEQKK